jgi:hypothetical protein
VIKPHRLFRERVTDIAGEANAYLRRKRADRQPFARVYYPGGRSASHLAEDPAGRALFEAAAKVVAVAGPPRTRRARAASAPPSS